MVFFLRQTSEGFLKKHFQILATPNGEKYISVNSLQGARPRKAGFCADSETRKLPSKPT